MVILTSFTKSRQYAGEKYSVARFQPEGYGYPTLHFLAATDKDGEVLHLKDLTEESVSEFCTKLKAKYRKAWKEIKSWLDELTADRDIILCCWCPYSRTSQGHVQQHNKFFCHTLLIGQMIQKHRPDIKVVYDDDRTKMLMGLERSNGKNAAAPAIPEGPWAVRIASKLLGEEIYLIDSEETREALEDKDSIVAYTASELLEILGMPREDLVELHEIKKMFMKSKIVEVRRASPVATLFT